MIIYYFSITVDVSEGNEVGVSKTYLRPSSTSFRDSECGINKLIIFAYKL
jgi:hypothetical protein